MKPEPLKDKTIRIGQKGKPLVDFKSDILVHLDEHIKSAVEWYEKEMEILFEKVDNNTIGLGRLALALRAKLKEAFEDVK